MKKNVLFAAIAGALCSLSVSAADPVLSPVKKWTYNHANTGVAGQTSEIIAYDSKTNTIWAAGIAGVDVLNANTGTLVQHISTSQFGAINSVAIHNGIAAFAIESTVDRTQPGTVKFFDTTTRALASGVNSITVGALPDMLTFTPNGSRLLVANEATPSVYGNPAVDPKGSVSIIDMSTRSLITNAGFDGVTTSGSNVRTNTGMNFEPENIAVNRAGTTAYVTLQEANAIGVLNLNTNSFASVIGLGLKDFSAPGNRIDPLNNGTPSLISPNVRGLYQPDGIAAYEAGGKTYLVMANEGDTREDDGDRRNASTLGATSPLNNLRVSGPDSSAGNLVAFGGRSFSIRDENGNLVFDSGDRLDSEAIARGIYDDGRSRDKGVEPEGLELITIGNRVFAFIGLERTTTGAVAIYDITDPAHASFIDMLATPGDLAPEGLRGFIMDGNYMLAIANETSGTTTLYTLAPVPEPEIYAMMAAGLGLIGFTARRRKKMAQ